ncbi:hypothetical protein ACYCFK_03220 [Stutzerimonas stutzeri]
MSDKPLLANPTVLEDIAGNPLTGSAMALAAACSPLGPLLPVLSGALASRRQAERLKGAFETVQKTLQAHSTALRALTDEQYKLINETILAMLHTTDPRKLEYLQQAIEGGLASPDIVPLESAVLSRIVRDISAEELDFVLQNFGHELLAIGKDMQGKDEKVLLIEDGTREALIATGLMGLGILVPAGSTWGTVGKLRFAAVTVKLIALFNR